MKKETKKYQIESQIKALEVGQHFNKREFITVVWGRTDYFVERSFDVMFNTVKKELADRKFKTEKGVIIRIK